MDLYLSDQGHLIIEDLPDEDALEFRSELTAENPLRFLTLDMDGATVTVALDHIVRVDFETGDA